MTSMLIKYQSLKKNHMVQKIYSNTLSDIMIMIIISDKVKKIILLALLIFLHRFHNNILLYLVSHLCFFDNNFSHSFLIYSKKIIKHLFYQSSQNCYFANCIIFANIPKVSSVSTSFNINNSNSQLFALNHDSHCKDMVHTSNQYLQDTNSDRYHILLMRLLY